MNKKPLIIAHRGLNREAPENTLPAFQRAKEIGADGVELDIMPSKDGVLVVTHDETLHRLAGIHGWVKHHTLAQLKELDFGSHFSPRFSQEKIPTLEEVFDLLKDGLLMNVEIKGTNIRKDGREEKLVSLIRKWKRVDQVVVSSFNIFALHRMKQIAPEIKRGYLFFEKQWGLSRRAGWAPYFSPYSLHLSRVLAKEQGLQRYHQKGYACWVWTVDEEEEAKKLIEEGVDALITNEPLKLLKLKKLSSS